MKTADLAPARLAELIERFRSCRLAVAGDFFLDKYLDIDPQLEETSVETGKPAHQVARVRRSPGAAGTVVCNLAALGAGRIHAIGFCGDDGEGYDLRRGLNRLGCSTRYLHIAPDRSTPTYLKPRDLRDPTLAGEHARYDTKNRTPTPRRITQKIIASVDALLPDLDALIVMDQVEEPDCGAVTRSVRESLAVRVERFPNVVFWADSRRRIDSFEKMIIKPNQFEAVGCENPSPGDEVDLDRLREAVERLRRRNGAPVVATCGARGMMVSDPEPTFVPGVAVEGETDPTGAGDSVTAAAVLALCAGAALPEAAVVGNLAASLTVQQIAVTGAARSDQLPQRLALWREQQQKGTGHGGQ